jgi:hypothetical protein
MGHFAGHFVGQNDPLFEYKRKKEQIAPKNL